MIILMEVINKTTGQAIIPITETELPDCNDWEASIKMDRLASEKRQALIEKAKYTPSLRKKLQVDWEVICVIV